MGQWQKRIPEMRWNLRRLGQLGKGGRRSVRIPREGWDAVSAVHVAGLVGRITLPPHHQFYHTEQRLHGEYPRAAPAEAAGHHEAAMRPFRRPMG